MGVGLQSVTQVTEGAHLRGLGLTLITSPLFSHLQNPLLKLLPSQDLLRLAFLESISLQGHVLHDVIPQAPSL